MKSNLNSLKRIRRFVDRVSMYMDIYCSYDELRKVYEDVTYFSPMLTQLQHNFLRIGSIVTVINCQEVWIDDFAVAGDIPYTG